jgi:hypothetical protein
LKIQWEVSYNVLYLISSLPFLVFLSHMF